MVLTSLTVGALVGILLSGGFVYYEIGRFAAPQVPVSRFDERKEMFAYTAGLFVGVPLAVAFVLLRLEIGRDLGLALLAALVGGTEAAQRLLLGSRFWSGAGGPFYALGFRAAIGGILALALVASYLGGPVALGLTTAAVAVGALALVALQVAGALLSLGRFAPPGAPAGRWWSGALVGAVGFFLLALGPAAGGAIDVGAACVVLLGATSVYLRARPVLERVAAPTPAAPPPPSVPLPFGRSGGPLRDPVDPERPGDGS